LSGCRGFYLAAGLSRSPLKKNQIKAPVTDFKPDLDRKKAICLELAGSEK